MTSPAARQAPMATKVDEQIHALTRVYRPIFKTGRRSAVRFLRRAQANVLRLVRYHQRRCGSGVTTATKTTTTTTTTTMMMMTMQGYSNTAWIARYLFRSLILFRIDGWERECPAEERNRELADRFARAMDWIRRTLNLHMSQPGSGPTRREW
ncbi:hypothetical protein VTK26DRAFT_2252 [Humicola hyalothermophila]